MTHVWPCSDSFCFPAPLSVSCTMDGIYPDDVQHCKMGKCRSHTLQRLHTPSVSSDALAVYAQNFVPIKFFLFIECMSKVTVFCNIQFNNDVYPKSVSLACQWAPSKWGKSNTESVLWKTARDVAKPLMPLQDSWQNWQPGALSDTTTKFVSPLKRVKKALQGYRIDFFWRRGFWFL